MDINGYKANLALNGGVDQPSYYLIPLLASRDDHAEERELLVVCLARKGRLHT